MNRWIKLATDTAWKAGGLTMEGFGKATEERKLGTETVTEYDLRADKLICTLLKEKSDYPIVSEESETEIPESDGPYWVVDPIDGTGNYARGNPLFAISIALIQQGKPLLGVVHMPALNELVWSDTKETYRNEQKVRLRAPAAHPAVIVGRGHGESDSTIIPKVVSELSGSAMWLSLGATAVELAFLACGRFDALAVVGDRVWDYAGGAARV